MDIDNLIQQSLNKCFEYLKENKFIKAKILSYQTTKVNPECHDAYMILGICLLKDQDNEKAKLCFLKCLESEKLKESAYNNLSICYDRLNQNDKSLQCILKCLDINPKKDYYWSQLALQYKKLNEKSKAEDAFLRAIETNPSSINHANYGSFLGDDEQYEKAAFFFEKAIKIDPNFSDPYIDLFHVHALGNKYNHKLWQNYEKRFDVYNQLKWVKEKKVPVPNKIEDCYNKNCLIYCEQGIGDTIMFLRYLKFIPKNIKFTVFCTKDTEALFKKMNLKTTTKLNEKKFDYYISFLSLPYYLKLSKIPKSYFPFKSKNKKFNGNIGVCWCGSPSHAHDKHRSINFKEFKEIFENVDFKIFSLVKNYSYRKYVETNEICDLSNGVLEDSKLIDNSIKMKSVLDTIKIILKNKISLIITVDTMVAHLAASMGIETWLLLSKKCDWRWSYQGKTKWYERNLKIFRQSKLDNWNDVIQKIKERLEKRSLTKGIRKTTKKI